ncbi:hypothetical protein MKW98_006508 [Papaver atlanticum]|uniref:RNA uridylyltransferase n=1 Tax=Papaver atlanticum TaxID=357466 RepID=A0AAD4XST5_9MAGN|nr:hypothetical protein MKW98_006508 [Papaver atlanticum]
MNRGRLAGEGFRGGRRRREATAEESHSQLPPQPQPQPRSSTTNSGGQFLLNLLQKPNQSQQQPQQNPNFTSSSHTLHHHHHHPQQQQQQQLQNQQQQHLDPAVAALGRSIPYPPPWNLQSNGAIDPSSQFLHPPGFSPPNPWSLQGLQPPSSSSSSSTHFPGPVFPDELFRLGLMSNHTNVTPNPSFQQHQQQQKQEGIMFGSLACDIQKDNGVTGLNGSSNFNEIRSNFGTNWELDPRNSNQAHQGNHHSFHDQRRGGGGGGDGMGGRQLQQQQQQFQRSTLGEARRGPPGFGHKEDNRHVEFNHGAFPDEITRKKQTNGHGGFQGNLQRLSGQFDHPGPPPGSNLHSVPASAIEESQAKLHQIGEGNGNPGIAKKENRNRDQRDIHRGINDLAEQFKGSVALGNRTENNNGIRQHNNQHDKNSRRLWAQQRMRNYRECRSDIDKLNTPFLEIYESLVPPEEEKAKQRHLIASLEKLVNSEWPGAQLYLYGSCANSFGVSKSDIDVCLAIEEPDINKKELIEKLAEIFEANNLENVKALTRARVPIVKLMDPESGISCDICVNNVLAVINTKLLRDYAQIDGRLRQLAFLVKHWAKSRGVNETYRGTLSSYAYVLMCIHFLQRRRPAILPCLQEMEPTYIVNVDDIQCAFFDKVENLRDFGAGNNESIAYLLWAFFDYWAHRHDYANSVISVRTGSIISKRAKDWTRRIGNDRHLICIEDPFETSHDLGRIVDKFTIKTLLEEFDRAADVMQYDPDPCVTLFEPYVPESDNP